MSYYSNVSGSAQVYVEPYLPTGRRWQLSDVGVDAIWSPDAATIYYLSSKSRSVENKWWSVKLNREGNTLNPEPPNLMFEGVYVDVFDRSFDISADGERFLMLNPVGDSQKIRHFDVILNWTEELKQLVPVD